MRVLANTFFRFVDADKPQQLNRTQFCFTMGFIGMKEDCLFDLIADRVDRVQRCHRILENHRDFTATDLPHLLLTHPVNAMAVELDTAADNLPRFRGNPHQAVRRHGFTRAGFSDYAEHLPFSQGHGDVIKCLHLTRRCKEGQTFVLDFNKIIAHRHLLISSSSGRMRRAGRLRRG